MRDERPAPPITLTDPLHPGPLHDVLGDEDRDPWRPTRRQVAVVLAVVLVVAAAVTPYQVISDRRERERRVVAASNIALLDASDGDMGRTVVPQGFTLSNTTDEPMELVSAQLDRYPRLPLTGTLPPHRTAPVVVPLPKQCPDVLPERPAVLVVRYRVRGHLKSTSLFVVGTTAAYRYRAALQNRCLLFLLPEAVSGVIVEPVARGRVLTVQVDLENVSGDATEVRRFEFVDGFAVTGTRPSLPVRFPGAASFERPSTLHVEVDLAVRDCATAQAFVRAYADDFSYVPRVTAVLVDHETELFVELQVFGAQLLGAARDAVTRSCP